MVSLSKKTDYALIALAYLAEQGDRTASAREIAAAQGVPMSLLMKILKLLHQHGLLHSTRGVKGGYQLAIDLDSFSLFDLIGLLEGAIGPDSENQLRSTRPTHTPVRALQYQLIRFLKDIKLSDLVMPG